MMINKVSLITMEAAPRLPSRLGDLAPPEQSTNDLSPRRAIRDSKKPRTEKDTTSGRLALGRLIRSQADQSSRRTFVSYV